MVLALGSEMRLLTQEFQRGRQTVIFARSIEACMVEAGEVRKPRGWGYFVNADDLENGHPNLRERLRKLRVDVKRWIGATDRSPEGRV